MTASGDYRSRHGLEQSRRNFKADFPELYEYIQLRETARALKSAGDTASGALDGHGAANRVWSMAARARERYEALREQPLPPGPDYAAERAATDPPVTLSLITRVPSKWLVTDRETGNRWEWRDGHWKRASD